MLFIGLSLVPCGSAGFFDDDSATSLWKYAAAKNHLGIIAFCEERFWFFLQRQGRVALVVPFTVHPFLVAIGDNLLAYRIYLTAAALVSAAIVYAALRRLLDSEYLACVAVGLFALLTTYHNSHDPYTSYAGVLPLLAALVLASVAAFDRLIAAWVRPAGQVTPMSVVRACLCHVAFLLLALGTYEFAVVIAPITLLMTWSAPLPRLRKIRLTAFIAAWCVPFIVGNVWMKASSQYPGTQFATADGMQFVKAYAIELAGTLPLRVPSEARMISGAETASVWGVGPILLGVGFGFAFLWSLCGVQKGVAVRLLNPSLAGLMLIFAVPIFTAVTISHQSDARLGYPYLQVYIQRLGLAIIGAAAVGRLSRARAWRGSLAIPLLMVVIATCLFVMQAERNFSVVAMRNQEWLWPRSMEEEALRRYPFDRTRPALIAATRDSLRRWESPGQIENGKNFIWANAGIEGRFTTLRALQEESRNSDPAKSFGGAQIYLLSSSTVTSPSSFGYVWLGKLRDNERTPHNGRTGNWDTTDNLFLIHLPRGGGRNVGLRVSAAEAAGQQAAILKRQDPPVVRNAWGGEFAEGVLAGFVEDSLRFSVLGPQDLIEE